MSSIPSFAVSFKNPTLLATPADPCGIATADLNRDGKPDLVYVSGTGTPAISIWLGNGDGTFKDAQDIAFNSPNGTFPGCYIAIADVNGDSIPDIILGNTGTSFTTDFAVYLGKGDGTFQPAIFSKLTDSSSGVYSSFGGMALADINGDGNIDIVAPTILSNKLVVLLGDGTGHFTVSTSFFDGARNVYLRDLNGDGHPDIVSINPVGATATVYLGKGDGTFQSPTHYSYSTATNNILLVDMDGDGHPDLLGVIYPGGLMFSKGNPDGTFGAPTQIKDFVNPVSLASTGDFDGTGNPDVVLLTPAGVGISLNSGRLNLANPISTLAAQPYVQNYAQADFNGDGRLDIALGVEGGIALLFGNGDGSFLSGDSYDLGTTVGGFAVASFTGGKLPDIAVSVPAQYPRVLQNQGNGQFTLMADPNGGNYGSVNPLEDLIPAKVDTDSFTDLIAFPPYEVFHGNGNGTFDAPVPVPNGSTLVADVNGDGRSDMLSVNSGNIVAVLAQSGGAFVEKDSLLRDPNTSILAVGDFNKDGNIDVLGGTSTAYDLYLGKGDGTFKFWKSDPLSSTEQFHTSPVLVDLDGDGQLDLVYAGTYQVGVPQFVVILYGSGPGTFSAPVKLPISRKDVSLVAADLNNDGKPDLVLWDTGGISVLQNAGNRTFLPEQHFLGGSGIELVTVKDVNGDGYPDIICSDTYGTSVAVLLNQPKTTVNFATATLGSTPNPSNYAGSFTVSLTLAGSSSGAPVPTGSINLQIDNAFIARVPLTSGSMSYKVTNTIQPGQHILVAGYSGDQNYLAQDYSLIQAVGPITFTSTTSLAAAPTTLMTSETLRLDATATITGPAPNYLTPGFITFYEGTNQLRAVPIDSHNHAEFDTALLSAGTHKITAKYSGSDPTNSPVELYLPSTSNAVTITVTNVATTTKVKASTTSLTAGTVATFQASVAAASGSPFGGITFYDGNVPLGTVGLDASGSASFSTALLGVGTHSIAATFNASGVFASSQAAPVSVTVSAGAGATSFTILNAAHPAGASGTVRLTATIASQSGIPGGVVTFLGDGSILGRAAMSADGDAYLDIPASDASKHFSASYSGGQGVAPSASPMLQEGGTPSYSLSLDSTTAQSSDAISIHVAFASDFSKAVLFQCASGLPQGYTCGFSPASLSNSGAVLLNIQRSGTAGLHRSAIDALLGMAPFSLGVLLMGGCFCRKTRLAQILSLFLFLGCCLVGCGISANPVRQSVVTIQATSGSGSAQIVHSAQVLIRFDENR